MAYRSRSGGRRSGSSYAGPARSSSPVPLVLALLVVVGGIAAVVVLTSGKKKKAEPPPVAEAPVQTPPAAPPKAPPKPPPYPPLSPDRIAAVRAEVKSWNLDETAKEAQVLYDAAMDARRAGDEATWQAKLREAEAALGGVNERWEEIVATMPTTKDYDENDVANHYLGAEANAVNKAVKLLGQIRKQLRMKGD